MKTVLLRSLLFLAFLALPAVPVAGQTQVEEIKARELEARRQMEEQLARVQETHALALREAHEHQMQAEQAYRVAMKEAMQSRAERSQVEQHALQLAIEEARRSQGHLAQEEQHALQLAVEEARRGQEHRVREQREALRAVLEQEREMRARFPQERQRALVRRVERLSDRENDLQQVVVRLRARARLGVSLDPRQGREYDVQGVLITDVHEDSPADGAGLEEGDIITHLNGHSLLDPLADEAEAELDEYESLPVQRLMALARELEDGEAVEVRYLRDGAQASASMVPAAREEGWSYAYPEGLEGRIFRYGGEDSPHLSWTSPEGGAIRLKVRPHLDELREHMEDLQIEFEDMDLEDFEFGGENAFRFRSNPNIAFFGPEGAEGNFQILRGGEGNAWSFYSGSHAHGLELRELNPDLGSYFSAEEGVLVMDVDEDSTLGLRAGDVILRIGEREVEDIRDVHRILGSYEEDEGVTLTIMRNGQQTTVEGTIG
jgi:C-terminal processing protease CtpA/Prc